jgi:hypothetical protein
MTIKIYPSSFAEPAGATTKTEYNSGCPVFEVFKRELPNRKEIDPIYSAIGTLGEEYHVARLGTVKEREIPIKYQLTDNIQISGRYDGICDEFVYEFKTTISRSLYTSIINKGIYKMSHLGQLVTYMCLLKRSKGKLCVAYAHFDKDITSLKFEPRDFIIEIRNDHIYVDDEPTKHTASGLMKFYSIIADAHLKKTFPPATINDKACFRCPLSDLCAFGTKDKSEFSKQIKEIEFVEVESGSPKIQIHNTRKKSSKV